MKKLMLLALVALSLCACTRVDAGMGDGKSAESPRTMTSDDVSNIMYYCFHRHVYVWVGHSMTPVFGDDDRPLRCSNSQ